MRLESETTAGQRTVLALLCAAVMACGGQDAGRADVESIDGSPAGATVGASSAAPGGAANPTHVPRVVILGTSLTAGLGLDPDSAWPALVQRAADSAGVRVQIVNAGLSGETSAGALRRADWVLGDAADLVVLEVGANDGLRGFDPDTTQATIEALIARVRTTQPSARIALVQMEAPPNLGASYTERFRDAYREAADRADVPLLPFLLDSVAGNPALNQSDGIHPNERGSRIVAATMWRSLEPIVRELGTPQVVPREAPLPQ